MQKCKDCNDRRVNCHSYCEHYLLYREKKLKLYAQKRTEFECDTGYGAYYQQNDRRGERGWKF